MARRRERMIRLSVALLLALVAVAAMPRGMGVAYAAGFIDFENGTDREAIKSTIPGLQFTTTNGQDWIYGDWRSRGYNGPYPTGSYFSNGNFFAWLGESQGDGRIDFTQGTASFISVQISSPFVVTIRGYDAANNVVAENNVNANNLNTGRLATLSLEAPGGETFDYVVISGPANNWLLDDLTTDAAGVPGSPPERRERPEADPALVTITERPMPNMVASRSPVDYGLFNNATDGIVRGGGISMFADAPAPVVNDGIIDYTLLVTNHGAGDAKDVVATMPFDGSALRLLDATFSTNAAYVSSIDTDAPSLTFHTGPIGPDGTVTVTIRLLVRPGTPDGTSLAQRTSFTWLDGRSGGSSASNQPVVVAGAADSDAQYLPVAITPADGAASVLRDVKATVFIPGESVSLWYNTPIGTAVALGTITADSNGTVEVTLDASSAPAGSYSLVAVGAWSQFTTVASFSVQP